MRAMSRRRSSGSGQWAVMRSASSFFSALSWPGSILIATRGRGHPLGRGQLARDQPQDRPCPRLRRERRGRCSLKGGQPYFWRALTREQCRYAHRRAARRMEDPERDRSVSGLRIEQAKAGAREVAVTFTPDGRQANFINRYRMAGDGSVHLTAHFEPVAKDVPPLFPHRREVCTARGHGYGRVVRTRAA